MGQNMLLMGTVGTLGGRRCWQVDVGCEQGNRAEMPGQTTQHIVSYRAGALASELKLSNEMKPFLERALGAGLNHDRIREMDFLGLHDNITEFQNALGNEIGKIKGIS